MRTSVRAAAGPYVLLLLLRIASLSKTTERIPSVPFSAFKMPEERKAAMGQEPGLTTVCVFLFLKFVGRYLVSASKPQLIDGVPIWCIEEVYRIKVERKAALIH